MSKDLGLGPSVEGVALGAFFATYALFQLPFGHYVDRIGERVMFGVAVVWWSVFSAATALAEGFVSLVGLRLALSGGLSIVGAFSYLFIVGRIEPLPLPDESAA
jgi:ACS family D-galactonate transporter-like MFS transporter